MQKLVVWAFRKYWSAIYWDAYIYEVLAPCPYSDENGSSLLRNLAYIPPTKWLPNQHPSPAYTSHFLCASL